MALPIFPSPMNPIFICIPDGRESYVTKVPCSPGRRGHWPLQEWIVRRWLQIFALGFIGTLSVIGSGLQPAKAQQAMLDEPAAARFAHLALTCLHQEYPNRISHVMAGDGDALPPHILTPAFYGCYDWHSDVHAHWLLVRLLRLFPNSSFEKNARIALALSLTAKNIAAEVDRK